MKKEKAVNSNIPTSDDKNYTIFNALFEAMVEKEKKESKLSTFFRKFTKKTRNSNTLTDDFKKIKNEKMKLEEESRVLDDKEKELSQKITFLEKKIMKFPNKKNRKKNILSSGCPHHFGYLASRPKRGYIPDMCLTCQKMLDCRF